MGEMMLLYYLAVLAFAACGLAVLVAAAWRLLAAAWGRRWQLCECILGASDCYLLPDSYCAAAIGSVLVADEDVYEGELSSDDDDAAHGHSHAHSHGPREVVVVEQRWAVVAGACGDPGRAMVRVLADQGFSLLIADPSADRLAAIALHTQRRLERGWRGGVWAKTREMPSCVRVRCTGELSDVRAVEEAAAALPAGALRLLVLASAGPRPEVPPAQAAEDSRILLGPLWSAKLARALWPRLAEGCAGGRRAGLLFLAESDECGPPAATPLAAVHAATLAALASTLRAEARGLGLPLDVLALPADATREGADLARAALLLLPTAQHAAMVPLLSDALWEAAVPQLWRRTAARMAACSSTTTRRTAEQPGTSKTE